MIIDCAFDEILCNELENYLTKLGFHITKESGGIIISNDIKLTEDDLELFLKRTGKIKELQIIHSENDVLIIVKKISIEGYGFVRCSICGFVMFEEELMAHERAHGIFLA